MDIKYLEDMYPEECKRIREDERKIIISFIRNNIGTILLNGLNEFEDKNGKNN